MFPRKGKKRKESPLSVVFMLSQLSDVENRAILNLPLIESFREAQEEEQTAPFSGVQNANASGS